MTHALAQETQRVDQLWAAVETKQLREGLTSQQTYTALKTNIYYALRKPNRSPLSWSSCVRVARWLDVSARDVLQWEGHWDKLSPLGRVLAPAMAARSLSQEDLARAAGTPKATVGRALWRSGRPQDATLRRWGEVLELNIADLRRAVREQAPAGKPRGIVRRVMRRSGRRGLRQMYEDQLRPAVRKLTHERRQAISRDHAVPGLRDWFASMTDAERRRWIILHLRPRPRARFGLCRVCGKLTYTERSTRAATGEYHGVCRKTWQSASPEWGAWTAAMQTARWHKRAFNVPMPEPSYPVGRRLNSEELASYYEAAVLYLRLKEGASSGPATVRDLAMQLNLARSPNQAAVRLNERVRRLVELLPDPAVCGRDWARRVEVILTLRNHLPTGGTNLAYA